MSGLADWLLERRPVRVVLMAVLFPMPLLAVGTAAIVALTTMARGWRHALADIAAAVTLVAVMTALAQGFWLQLSLGAGLTWLLALLLGQLRRSGSLNLAVQVAVLLGFLGALVFTVWSRDPHAYWEDVLRDFGERLRAAGIDLGPSELMPAAAQLMTGVMSASAVASSLGALFLGTWWAAGSDVFRAEFRELRMGRVMGLLAAVMGALLLTSLRPSVDDLLLVLSVGFVVQGLAVIHWHAARRQWPRWWPLLLYMPLVSAVGVTEMLLLALLGLLDNGLGLRRQGENLV